MKLLEVQRPHCAGIDVGSEFMFVGFPDQSVKQYETTTPGLERLVDELVAKGINSVALESTGVYGLILMQMLRARELEVFLVHPKYTRSRSGKKTDVQDCQWIQQLHKVDLLEPSFVPEAEIEILRSYVRLRDTHIEAKAQTTLRMQKALIQMNLRLDTVLSQVHGASGMRIIRAILEGERDPEKLLALCDRRIIKRKAQAVRDALVGFYRADHLFALGQAVKQFDFLQEQLEACDKQIERQLEALTDTLDPPEPGAMPDPKPIRHNPPQIPQLQRYMFQLCGHRDLTQLPGFTDYSLLKLTAELGTDLSAFPTAKHFTSWLQLAPKRRDSGKRKRNARTKGSPKATEVFRQLAQSLINSKRHALGDFGRRKKANKGPGIAIKALARKLAVLYYHAMTRGIDFVEQGIEQYQRQLKEQQLKHFLKQAQKLGVELAPDQLETALAWDLS